MPELPEVESVIRTLKKDIIGQKIIDLEIRYSKMILEDITSFKNHLINATFIDILRKGKFIIFKLDNGYFLISHLRMEGKYFLEKKNSLDNKHIHVIFHLSDYDLYYQDVRKFGIMVTKDKNSLFNTPPLDKVANDPLEGINEVDLFNKLKKKKNTIKEALLDQSIISGLGNIYVDEVLFLSHINPKRCANLVDLTDCRNIINYSKEIFLKSIELGGTTIKSFTSSKNHIGQFQNNLLVHTKEICPICKNKLEIIKIGGRSTYYCKICQSK